jgi:hypothetical protein
VVPAIISPAAVMSVSAGGSSLEDRTVEYAIEGRVKGEGECIVTVVGHVAQDSRQFRGHVHQRVAPVFSNDLVAAKIPTACQ